MNSILLSEAVKDLERVVTLAQDSGPVMLVHEGRIVAEVHPHAPDDKPLVAEKKRSLEEVWRSMDELQKVGPGFGPGELEAIRLSGRRY